MDNSVWIGFAILIGVIILLGYLRKASLGNTRKPGDLFDRITKEKHLYIKEKITWDNGIIDENKLAVVFVQEYKHELQHSVFYLHSIESCKVIYERTPNFAKIILRFDFSGDGMEPFEVCFYDSTVDIMGNVMELKKRAEKAKEGVYKVMKNRTHK